MTSNTSPSPVVITGTAARSDYPALEKWRLFDKVTDASQASYGTNSGFPVTVTVDLGVNYYITGYGLYFVREDSAVSLAPSAWTFQTSTDGSNFSVRDTKSGISFTNGEQKNFTLTSTQTCRYIKWNITSSPNGTYFEMKEMQINGYTINYKEKLSINSRNGPKINNYTQDNYPFYGYLAEYRISKGIARYTNTFTPQTTPFDMDQYTSLLLHFRGEDGSQTIIDETGKTMTDLGGNCLFNNFLSPLKDSIIFTDYSPENTQDGNMVVLKCKNLTINNGATLTPKYRSKGMMVLVNGDCTINGNLSMTARGASAVGSATDLDFYKLGGRYEFKITQPSIDSIMNYIKNSLRSDPNSITSQTSLPSSLLTKVERTIYPQSIALGSYRSSDTTKLLLHCNGVNNSTTFVDSSNYSNSLTTYGTAKISTTRNKFGGSSLYLDGNQGGCYIRNPELDMRTNQFCIDFWVNFNTYNSGNQYYFYQHYSNTTMWYIKSYNGNIDFNYYDGSGYPVSITKPFTPSLNTWYHIAVTRDSSNDIRVFVNGTQSGTTVNNNTNIIGNSNLQTYPLQIGQNTGTYNDCYINELRHVIGSAVYTSNFTPPTSQYSPSAITLSDYKRVSLPSTGGSGGASVINAQGITGFAGTNRGSGGGGSGNANYGITGRGGNASTWSGGSGSGGNAGSQSISTAQGSDSGGPGSNSFGAYDGGGAGNPGGLGNSPGSPGSDGTGGVIILVVKGNLTIGSTSTISANGSSGGASGYAGGGGSGGGSINILYGGSYTNSGTITASVGAGGAGGGRYGGSGGAGCVTIEKIDFS